MRRRNFLGGLAGGATFSWLGLRSNEAKAAGKVFQHGVASGDPLSDRVILWTRISGADDDIVEVLWSVASDTNMQDIVREGTTISGADRDYTVKVDAADLPAGATLWYQFEYAGQKSPVGRTRTSPTGSLQAANFAVVSCSNYPYGYFNAYREVAMRDDIDAVVHLGDYIYEYGMGEYATEMAEELGRVPEPPVELVSLSDYRQRHAQYKRDVDSQAMHQQHPLIAIWDDHEVNNDSWRAGALNHGADAGSWNERRDAAVQAYLEWMPIRASHAREHTRIFRRFEYGDLLSLIMLDTRLYGRDVQPDVGDEVTMESVTAAMGDPERRMLGHRQEYWLRDALRASEQQTWQIIGQQVLLTSVLSPDLESLIDPDKPSLAPPEQLQRNIELSKSNPPLLLDTWAGYPIARQDFLKDLYEYAANPVIVSGDLHTPLAGELRPWGYAKPVAVEFMTGAVSSPGFSEYLPEREPGAIRDATLALNEDLKYINTEQRGWMLLKVTHEDCTAEWHLLDTAHSREYSSEIDRRLSVKAGQVSAGFSSN